MWLCSAAPKRWNGYELSISEKVMWLRTCGNTHEVSVFLRPYFVRASALFFLPAYVPAAFWALQRNICYALFRDEQSTHHSEIESSA